MLKSKFPHLSRASSSFQYLMHFLGIWTEYKFYILILIWRHYIAYNTWELAPGKMSASQSQINKKKSIDLDWDRFGKITKQQWQNIFITIKTQNTWEYYLHDGTSSLNIRSTIKKVTTSQLYWKFSGKKFASFFLLTLVCSVQSKWDPFWRYT